MDGQVRVDPQELRASAAAARNIGEEFRPPADTATAAGRAAGGALAGWSIGPGLHRFADDWAPVLGTLAERLTGTAAALEATALAHERNDHRIADTWRLP
ncbi:hypothetical protein Kpho02_51090 [Kitasatospora phosalacinea]|uniref:Excreted virulence factor EspC (Type VII ESX diderm) n=1 Tax=Kitasatospora phosalacinea TaxID=2065 RepID=A0A9W6Q9F5_9ACTN|nr:hypothetical protein [Kitasatospora phosalacinea]GLW72810.1 hypothetical protein Kpho02_51090 [Kitasatospora phosalacinea]